MKRMLMCIVLPGVLLASCAPAKRPEFAAAYGKGTTRLVVATGSPGELGLLDCLATEFSRRNGVQVLWRKAGTGESLQLLHDRQADVVMVHGPAAERKAVAEGWAVNRTLIGSNEFYLVGPPADPARVGEAKTIVDAYQRIAKSQARFLSRADNSGTHQKEIAVWQKAGVVPGGDWYVPTKSFMVATLLQADAEQAYFMTDSSTWIATRSRVPHLKILFRGDPFIVNTYHAYCHPAETSANAGVAARFISFVASPEGQKIIRDFGQDQYGEGLYNDADYARRFE